MHYQLKLWPSARHWQRYASAILAALLLAAQLGGLPPKAWADTGSWTGGDMPVLTTESQVANGFEPTDCYPTTFTYWSYTKTNGLYDSIGRPINVSACASENSLGVYGGSSTNDNFELIKPQTTFAFHTFNAVGNLTAVTPIPDQQIFFTKDSSQSFNGEVAPHFYDSFQSAGTFGPVNNELAFTFSQPGAVLADSAGTKIYMFAYAFSRNGEWMVVEARGTGLIRVNTRNRAMQLFDSTRLTYGQGFRPQMTLAISDDGNTVIKSGKDAGDTYAYDLGACQPGSFTVGGADNSSAVRGCGTRSLQSSLKAQLGGFNFLTAMHFSGDGKSISAIAQRTGVLGVLEYYKVTYALAGYQAPHLSYLALGDSFSSGEGAFSYEPGTGSNDPSNKCHLSVWSYPYVAAGTLGITDFHSVACSGARTVDYSGKQSEQNKTQSPLGDWVPGYQGQSKYFNLGGKVSVVTISMIGNDIGFADKLTACLNPLDECFHFKEERQIVANEIYSRFDTLVGLYSNIGHDAQNDAVKVYVLGYPQIVGDESCSANVWLSPEERQMAQGLVTYLDAVIKAATIKAGVQYIDVEHAFDGHRLCEPGAKAMNGLIGGPDKLHVISNGSFHPNAYGHQLMAQALLAQSQDFTLSMPTASDALGAPYAGSEAYDNFIANAPSAALSGAILYAKPTTVATRITSMVLDEVKKNTQLTVRESQALLQPNSLAQIWFNSSPVLAGTIATDAQGAIDGQVTIPSEVEPGYHIVHIVAKDVGGSTVDLYQGVYVAASDTDVNGDGIPDAQQQCVIVPDSGHDQDKDGIDDACDGEIAVVPADTAPPIVTGVVDREPDHDGWYNHDATISWIATDPEPSSGPSTQPATTAIDQEGKHAYISDPSCDPAGNCESGSITIKLDKTAPDITYSVLPSPNANGWNKSAVTVTFSCQDVISGIELCSGPVTLSSDGTYAVTGMAIDEAGNSSGVDVFVSVDSTAPTVTNTLLTNPNANGWYNSGVTVTPRCEDNLSGVAFCSQPVTVFTEGTNQAVVGEARDNAGNTASAVSLVSVDKTAPVVTSLDWSGNPKAITGPATLTVHADDNLSGVLRAEYYIGENDPGQGNGAPLLPADGAYAVTFGADFPTGVYRVTVRVQDAAGNWSAATSDYLVVYNPFSVRMTGRRMLMPSLANGDILPGLTSTAQTDQARFAFSVGYDRLGQPLANDFQFSYGTGTDCHIASKAQDCHSFELDAASIDWLTTDGANSSTGIFQGKASLNIDGAKQKVVFIVSGIDGERLNRTASDHLQLRVYPEGTNPAAAWPIYKTGADVLRGNIHIKV